jgi:hypothetical protein
MIKGIIIWGMVATISAIVAGFLAASKRRDHSSWAAWAFVFPPIVLVYLLVPKNKGEKHRQRTLDEEDAAGA